jgi:hypothetical protein
MNIMQFIGIVLIITCFIGLIYEVIKARRSKESYQILLEHQYEHYMKMFNQIYETVKEENIEGTLVCKYKIREEVRSLFPKLTPEILICNIKKTDIVGE